MSYTSDVKSFFGLNKGDKIFFTGIGGYSMCGLAQICHKKGFIVSGSDNEISHRTALLENEGIKVYYGNKASSVEEFNPDCLVYSVAVPTDNPEIVKAHELGIQVIERSYFLGGLNRLYEKVINIAGTHGKTTTTTLCALMLEASKLDPTAHIGAEVSAWGNTVRIGDNSNLFVSEACEYNSSFLRFYSTTAAILNIDHDHVDCFPTIEDVIDAFVRFANTLPDEGQLVIPTFDNHIPLLIKLLRKMRKDAGRPMPKIITFGRKGETLEGKIPDFFAANYRLIDGYPDFDVYIKGKLEGHARLVIPGEYNAMNALAAITCSVLNGASIKECIDVISSFYGADNRFTLRGKYKGAKVYSDYAHHPSAITVASGAAHDITNGDVWVIFQPITFNRAVALFEEFVNALSNCKNSILLEVYSSRENDAKGFSSKLISDRIIANGGNSIFASDFSEIKNALDEHVKPGDVILFMGPEKVKGYADRLVSYQEGSV